jgi:hypothetical protein
VRPKLSRWRARHRDLQLFELTRCLSREASMIRLPWPRHILSMRQTASSVNSLSRDWFADDRGDRLCLDGAPDQIRRAMSAGKGHHQIGSAISEHECVAEAVGVVATTAYNNPQEILLPPALALAEPRNLDINGRWDFGASPISAA